MVAALTDNPPAAESVQGTSPAQSIAIPSSRQAAAFIAGGQSLLQRLEDDERKALAQLEAARSRARAARMAAEAMRKVLAFVSVESPTDALQNIAPERPWSLKHAACVNCGTTRVKHASNGRCQTCEKYWRSNGTERPVTTKESPS